MKFFQWGGEQRREPEPARERRGTLNRERLIAKMASCQEAATTIRHSAGGGEPKDSAIDRLEERYGALRSILVDTLFETSTIDEMIGVVYGKELASVGHEKSTLEAVRLSLTMDDGMSGDIIRNMSVKVSDTMRRATKYGRILYGIGEAVGYLPDTGSKKLPIYLGSQVRYATKNGDSGIARIVKFIDYSQVFKQPDAAAFEAITKPDPSSDKEVQFQLRISEIVDVYDA